MSKIVLNAVADLTSTTTAQTTINNNSNTIQTAFDNTLSRDGTSPNQMGAPLDMNSNRVINLPAPTSNFDAVRFVDVTSLGTGGSIIVNPLPTGGTTGQILSKNSGTNFDVGWSSVVTGVNVTAGKTLSATNTLTLSGTDATTMTFPSTSGNVLTDSSTNTLTNKSFNTSATGNNFQINGTSITSVNGTGNSAVLQNAPTLGNPTFTGSVTAPNLITNAALTQSGAATIKGNPTASTANITDFTVQGLTDIGTPSGSLDFIPIFDHVSGTIKKAQPVNIAAVNTAGVTSIAGNTGAFTLGAGITNSTNVIQMDASYHRGFLGGLNLSGGGSQVLTVSAGVACSDDFSTLMKLPSTFTKAVQTAWAVGTGNGSLDTGAIANSTWYHVYVIERLDTSVVDILTSVNATSPTLPTNYTVKRRIGSFKTDGSANILGFSQTGDTFIWNALVTEFGGSVVNPGTSAVSRTLIGVPTGVVVEAMLNWFDNNGSTNHYQLITPLTVTDVAASVTAFTWLADGSTNDRASPIRVFTNTSAQIRTRQSASGVSDSFGAVTTGWVDIRGRFA